MISTYNTCDFGRRAIQCIADFSFAPEIARSLHPLPPGAKMFYRDGLLRKAYLGFCRSFARPSGRNPLTEDMVLANSHWTARLLRERFGTQAEVLYPPVAGDFPAVAWEDRENGFVCLGRVAPEKRIERIIEILAKVRQAGHDVHLHVVGSIGDDSYGRMIGGLCRQNAAWVHADGPLYGPAKAAMLTNHRYGLHGCQGEAFGIAVAEMVKAGCIAFVPGEGGQAEVVGHADLTYSSVEEAAGKIITVLRDEARQAALREHLAGQAGLFGVEQFKAGICDAVKRFHATRA